MIVLWFALLNPLFSVLLINDITRVPALFLFCSNQWFTIGVTKAVVCVILSVG